MSITEAAGAAATPEVDEGTRPVSLADFLKEVQLNLTLEGIL